VIEREGCSTMKMEAVVSSEKREFAPLACGQPTSSAVPKEGIDSVGHLSFVWPKSTTSAVPRRRWAIARAVPGLRRAIAA
jgi:hypothetical protein